MPDIHSLQGLSGFVGIVILALVIFLSAEVGSKIVVFLIKLVAGAFIIILLINFLRTSGILEQALNIIR
jgi:hypothetical protein